MSTSRDKWRYRPVQNRNQLRIQKNGSAKSCGITETRRKSVTTEDIPMLLERWSTPALEVTKLLEENEVLKKTQVSSPVSKYGLEEHGIPFARSFSSKSLSKRNTWELSSKKKWAKTTDDLEFLKRKAEKEKKKRISRNLEMLEVARDKIRAQKLKSASSLPVSARGNSQGFDFSVKVNYQQFQQGSNSPPKNRYGAFNDRDMFQRREDKVSAYPAVEPLQRSKSEGNSTFPMGRASRITNDGGRKVRKGSSADNYYKGIDQDIYNILNKRRSPREEYRKSPEKGDGKCLDPEVLFLLYGLPFEPNKSNEHIEEENLDATGNKLFEKPYSPVEARFIRDFMMKYPNYTSEEVISVIKSTPLEKYHSRAAWFQTLRTKLNALGPRFDFDSNGFRPKDRRLDNSIFSDGISHESVALNSMVKNPRFAGSKYSARPRSRPNSLLDWGEDLKLPIVSMNKPILSGTEKLEIKLPSINKPDFDSSQKELVTLKSLLSKSLTQSSERRGPGTHSRPNTLLDGAREPFQPGGVTSPVYYSFKPTSPMVGLPKSPGVDSAMSNSPNYQTSVPTYEAGALISRDHEQSKKNWDDYENHPEHYMFHEDLKNENLAGYQGMSHRGGSGYETVWKSSNKVRNPERGYLGRGLV